MRFEIRRRAGWQGQVRDWMTCVRTHLQRHPGVVPLIGRRGRTSPAWFDATGVLIEILERAGLRGAALARGMLWVAETTMGILVMQSTVPFSEQIDDARRALPEMSEEARRRHAPLIDPLSEIDEDDFFELVVDRTIAALAYVVPAK
jgi:hypothetical protein